MTCYPRVDAIIFREAISPPDYDAGPPVVPGIDDDQIALYYKSDGKWYVRLKNGSEQEFVIGGGSVAWDDITGKPYEYTPTAHTHAWEEMHDIGWQPLSLLGSWGNYNAAYEYAAYRRRNNLVTLRGIVSGGSPGNSNICRLPLSCQPQKSILLPIVGGHSLMTLYVQSDGYIRTAAHSTMTWRSLNVMFFIDNG